MTNVNTAAFGFGANQATAPTPEDIATFRQMVPALNLPGIDVLLRAPLEKIELNALGSASAGSTADTETWSPPFPIQIVSAQGVCVSAAGATGTFDLQVKPSGGSFATVLAAAVDVKTGAGVFQTGTVIDTDDANLVETTGQIKGVFASGSGGALASGRVIVWYVRQSPTDAA